MARKFVRFVIAENDPVTGQQVGFFAAAYKLRRRRRLPESDQEEISALLDWFDERLIEPKRFARSNNKHAHEKALSWFKPEASEHIGKARRLLSKMAEGGIVSEMITSDNPGYVVYEDEQQIVAVPYRDRW